MEPINPELSLGQPTAGPVNFRGTYRHSCVGGRISLPASYRKVLENRKCERLLMKCFDTEDEQYARLEVYPEAEFDAVEDEQYQGLKKSQKEIFEMWCSDTSNTIPVEFDEQYRIVINKELMTRLKLGKEVILHGAKTMFFIWPADKYDEYREKWNHGYRYNAKEAEHRQAAEKSAAAAPAQQKPVEKSDDQVNVQVQEKFLDVVKMLLSQMGSFGQVKAPERSGKD